jgi:serine/threonine-protein kinase
MGPWLLPAVRLSQGAPVEEVDDVAVELLGRYTVRERLTRGGMSVVYRAHDERLNRRVCIKVFSELDRSRVINRTIYDHFLQEVFTLSQLRHPNTLEIYDFGYLDEAPQRPFYVSEFMDGGTLRTRVLEQGGLHPLEALQTFEPIIGALAEAHARGIIHRDVKPTNILFGQAGTQRIVKLADFGIAKAVMAPEARPASATETPLFGNQPLMLYSPGWAAPEQLRGIGIGATSDVFGLGLLLAFTLSGKQLFTSADLDWVLESNEQADTLFGRSLDQLMLPPALREVVVTACRFDPAARFPGVEAMLVALREACAAPSAPNSPNSPNRSSTGEGEKDHAPATEIVFARRSATKDPLDIELAGPEALRLRLTLLPHPNRGAALHLKGLNCFVARPGLRVSPAVEVADTAVLDVVSPDRRRRHQVQCLFGEAAVRARITPSASDTRSIRDSGACAARPMLLDFGPDRELALLYDSQPVVRRGER